MASELLGEEIPPELHPLRFRRSLDLARYIARDATQADCEKLEELGKKYRCCFATSFDELGHTNLVQMDIEVTSEETIQHEPRRLSHRHQEELDCIIRALLRNSIIQESYSEYASPIVLTPGVNGCLRMNVDYRDLNKITKPEKIFMPNVEEQLNGLVGASIFSVLDFMSGCYQVNVNPESRHLTAFITPGGNYEFRRMPFGLINCPVVFMKLMAIVTSDLNKRKIVVSMDDVLIASSTVEEHLDLLDQLLYRLKEAKLMINLEKCQFLMRAVTYLGHRIDGESIHPGDIKTLAVKEFPVPKDEHNIRQFLGLVGYFSKFIPNFAQIAAPLSDQLTKRNGVERIVWEVPQQEAFGKLKQALNSGPVLKLFNSDLPDLPHELRTGASSKGLTGVLIQEGFDNSKGAVSYFSRKTSDVESKYELYELEILAVKESCERFKYQLLNRRFTLVTDSKALQLGKTNAEFIPHIARWMMAIQEYDFEVKHRHKERQCSDDSEQTIDR